MTGTAIISQIQRKHRRLPKVGDPFNLAHLYPKCGDYIRSGGGKVAMVTGIETQTMSGELVDYKICFSSPIMEHCVCDLHKKLVDLVES